MADLGDHGLDMPFEGSSGEELADQADALYSGGLIIMAAVAPVPHVGPKPALVFRFAKPTGEFYPPIVLVQDDDQMAKLRPLINEATAAARRAAQVAPR